MPFTPYHFGISGFLGIIFRKWIDVPVFILANVAVDIEVAFIGFMGWGWPYHRICHTILGGIAVGTILGLIAYHFIPTLKWCMNLIRLPYESNLKKLTISGILGAWLHIIVDATYHYDARIFWPLTYRPLYNLLTKNHVKIICLIFWGLMIIPYIFAVRQYYKDKTTKITQPGNEQ